MSRFIVAFNSVHCTIIYAMHYALNGQCQDQLLTLRAHWNTSYQSRKRFMNAYRRVTPTGDGRRSLSSLLLADPARLGPSDLLEPRESGLELFVSPQRSRVLKATIVGGLLKREEKVWQVVTT
jgi:hypothetical protein